MCSKSSFCGCLWDFLLCFLLLFWNKFKTGFPSLQIWLVRWLGTSSGVRFLAEIWRTPPELACWPDETYSSYNSVWREAPLTKCHLLCLTSDRSNIFSSILQKSLAYTKDKIDEFHDDKIAVSLLIAVCVALNRNVVASFNFFFCDATETSRPRSSDGERRGGTGRWGIVRWRFT